MSSHMSSEDSCVEVLIVGNHPCSYLAAALLREKPALRVLHVCRQTQRDHRLALLNPAFYSLHPMLAAVEKSLKLSPIFGLKFLSDDPAMSCEHCAEKPMVYVCDYQEMVDAMCDLAQQRGVEMVQNVDVAIDHLDERGASVKIDGRTMHPSALILSEPMEKNQQRMLGFDGEFDHEVFYRVTSMAVAAPAYGEEKVLTRMSLDVGGSLAWGWLLVHDGKAQAVVAQPISSLERYEPVRLFRKWIAVLKAHKELPADVIVDESQIRSCDWPLGGALAQEGIGNRTLLIGPAGGFYSACGEDLYPNCWSAVFAVDVLRKAMRETHLQDAINPYRIVWRTTLGDYLRGPQQNLRFLLPLIYRNQTMAGRLTEAILLGKSVVR